MDDYRIAIGWRSHPKRRRLRRRLGADAVLALQDLWEYCATPAHGRTDGDLTGMTDEAIADAAGWDGDADAFVSALRGAPSEPQFLEGVSGAYRLHDWKEHQPFVASYESRVVRARQNASKRYAGRGMPPACESHTTGKPPAEQSPAKTETRHAPSPSPSPSPSPTDHTHTLSPGDVPAETLRAVLQALPDLGDGAEGLLSEILDLYRGVDVVEVAKELRLARRTDPEARARTVADALRRWCANAHQKARGRGAAGTTNPPKRATAPADTPEEFRRGPRSI